MEPLPDSKLGDLPAAEVTAKMASRQSKENWVPVKILDERVPVYAGATIDSKQPFVLTDFPEIQLGGEVAGFVHIQLPDGREGFVLVTTRVFRMTALLLKQDGVALHREADSASPVLATLAKGASVTSRAPVMEGNGAKWLKVSSAEGETGFINAEVKMSSPDAKPGAQTSSSAREPKRASRDQRVALIHMKIGGFILVAGALTFVISGLESWMDWSLVFVGVVMIFGGLEFFLGLHTYRRERRRARRSQPK